MADERDEADPESRWPFGAMLPTLVVVFGIGLLGLVRGDLTLAVEYRWGRVVDILQVPGRDLSERLVLIEMDDRRLALRTGDRLLRLHKGDRACIQQRHMLLRRWVRRSLALAPFCRHADLRVW